MRPISSRITWLVFSLGVTAAFAQAVEKTGDGTLGIALKQRAPLGNKQRRNLDDVDWSTVDFSGVRWHTVNYGAPAPIPTTPPPSPTEEIPVVTSASIPNTSSPTGEIPVVTPAPDRGTNVVSEDSNGDLTIAITNSYGQPLSLAFGVNAGWSAFRGDPKPTALAAAATTSYAVPSGWAGRINVGKIDHADNSKIEGSFYGAGKGDVDISYVDGYSVPITCSVGGKVVTGCNLELFDQGCNAPETPFGIGEDGKPAVCLNSARPRNDGPPSPFFAPCAGAAYTFPNDNAANVGELKETLFSCCIGTACEASQQQKAQKRDVQSPRANAPSLLPRSQAVPKDLDPYNTLNLSPTASAGEIKTAYKKLALKHHPDKAPASEKHTAHTTFQNIAFAYAILSSPHRRQLYDSTGSTSETLAGADDGFDWLSFFRNQYSSLSASALSDFSTSYKSSAEERRHVLAAYTKHKGKMGKVYEEVMLSNPLEDEEPFRTIIHGAIDEGEVEAYDAFVKESKKSKDARMRKARKEAGDAEKEAKTNKKYQSIFGGDGKGGRDATSGSGPEDGDAHGNGAGVEKKKKKKGDTSDLAAMIQLRQAARSDDFLGRLEAKYAGDAAQKTTSRGKKRKAVDEPDDEAFEQTKAKMAKAKAGEADPKANGKKTTMGARRSIRPVADEADTEEEEEDEDIDLENGTDGDEEEEEDEEDPVSDVAEEESEEEAEGEVRPRRKAQKSKTSSKKAPPTPPPPAAKKKKKTAPATATTRGRARGKK
ncbi:MAG: hypothetical protein Q9185_002272 [Variospora sp. 1 TL-2023]